MRRIIYAFLSLISLAICLAFPVMRFLERISAERYKIGLVFASIAWFIFASLWAVQTKEKG
jgi:hypothetical protein